jgi:hypothetical protein
MPSAIRMDRGRPIRRLAMTCSWQTYERDSSTNRSSGFRSNGASRP